MKYNFLGNTGLLVSELCFGTMTFGGRGRWMAIGQQPQEEANALLKICVEAGINFFDTANAYSEGLSEEMLGQGIRDLGLDRHDLVIATKARIRMAPGVNRVGLSRVHLMQEVEASLRRMNTDFIDLYQIHGVDAHTPLEETLRALEDIVRSGKVRYVGCCNLPAWQVMKALGIAERRGWDKMVSCQHYYSLASRDIERELVPMLQDQQLALLPWSPLAGGLLSGKFTRENQSPEDARRTNFDFPIVDKERAFDCIEVMAEIAKAHQVSVAQIALTWQLHQPFVTSVIIGAKTQAQLVDNLGSVSVKLSDEELERLQHVSQLPPEYPGWMVNFQSRDRLPENQN
ncbi:MAG: aldo/keto reductase [Microscillaceae bacterium]